MLSSANLSPRTSASTSGGWRLAAALMLEPVRHLARLAAIPDGFASAAHRQFARWHTLASSAHSQWTHCSTRTSTSGCSPRQGRQPVCNIVLLNPSRERCDTSSPRLGSHGSKVLGQLGRQASCGEVCCGGACNAYTNAKDGCCESRQPHVVMSRLTSFTFNASARLKSCVNGATCRETVHGVLQ